MNVRTKFLRYLTHITKERRTAQKLKALLYLKKLCSVVSFGYYSTIVGIFSLKAGLSFTDLTADLFKTYPVVCTIAVLLYVATFFIEYWAITCENYLKRQIYDALFKDYSLTSLNLTYKNHIDSHKVQKSDELIQVLMQSRGILDELFSMEIYLVMALQWGLFFLLNYFAFYKFLTIGFLTQNYYQILVFAAPMLAIVVCLDLFRARVIGRLSVLQRQQSVLDAQGFTRWFKYAHTFDSYLQSSKLTHFLNLKTLVLKKMNSLIDDYARFRSHANQVAIDRSRMVYLYRILSKRPFLRTLALGLSFLLASPYRGLGMNLIALLVYTWSDIIEHRLEHAQVDLEVAKLDLLLSKDIAHYATHSESSRDPSPQDTIPEANLTHSALRVRDLTHEIDHKSVLKEISFCLKPGEKVALIGPSGSGKSTLMLLCAGYPEELESISLDHADGRLRQNVFLIAQESEFYEDTIKENICCGYTYDAQVLLKMAVNLDPETKIYRNALNLSGGQKQRLALARAYHLLRNRKQPIVILDQPFSAMDPSLKETVFKQFMEDFKDRTILTITHDYHGLRAFDRVLYLKAGKLVFNGPPAHLIENFPEVQQFST